VENENKYEKISDYPLIKTETFGNEYFQKVPFEGKSYKCVKKYISRWKIFEIYSKKHYNLNIKIKEGKSGEKQMVKTMCCSNDVICFCWNVRF